MSAICFSERFIAFRDIINAGKETATLLPGASTFGPSSSLWSVTFAHGADH